MNRSPCACTLVKKVARVLGRTYDAALVEAGVNNTQFSMLRAICRHRGEPLVRVAEDLEMDRTSFYRAIDPMVRDGWVVVTNGPDARARSARLTAKGSRILENATRNWSVAQSRILGTFGRADFASLVAEMERLARCAQSANR